MKTTNLYIIGYLTLTVLLMTACQNELVERLAVINQLQAEASQLQKQQSLLAWYYYSKNRPMALAESDAMHDALLTTDTLRFVRETLDMIQHHPEQKAELQHFLAYLQRRRLESAETPFVDKIRLLRDSDIIIPGNTRQRYGLLTETLGSRPLQTHDGIFAAARPHALAILALRHQAVTRRIEHADEDRLSGKHSRPAPGTARAFLDNTQAEYEQLFTAMFPGRRVPIPLGTVLQPLYDSRGLLSGDQISAAMIEFLRGMGIRANRQSGLTITNVEAGHLGLTATCIAVAVPADIRIIRSAAGGLDAASAQLRAFAKAEALLFIGEDSPIFEQFPLPDGVQVTQALFERVICEAIFSKRFLKLEDETARILARRATFYRLFQLRNTAIALLCNREEKIQATVDHFRENMHALQRLQLSEAGSAWLLAELPPAEECNIILEASTTAAALEAFMKQKYQTDWYGSIAAGKFLKSIWAHSGSLTFAEIRQFANFKL